MGPADVIADWAGRILGPSGVDLRSVWHLTHPTYRTHLADELLVEISPAMDELAGDEGEGRTERAMQWASLSPPADHLAAGFFVAAALRLRRPFDAAGFLDDGPPEFVVDVHEATATARAVSPSGLHGVTITAELLDGAWLVSDLSIEALT